MWIVWTLAGTCLAAGLGIAAWCYTLWRRRCADHAKLCLAKELFHRRREWLEADFLSLASAGGKPRRLVWSGCDFANEVAFARDRSSGQLRALVAVTISFTSIESGGQDDVRSETTHRAATSVFRFDGRRWTTDGRAVFNLNPHETIRRYRHELELAE
ncbi:MAG: hypothetical protein ACYC3X_09050 [Pirellulaceae bacterium]